MEKSNLFRRRWNCGCYLSVQVSTLDLGQFQDNHLGLSDSAFASALHFPAVVAPTYWQARIGGDGIFIINHRWSN